MKGIYASFGTTVPKLVEERYMCAHSVESEFQVTFNSNSERA